MRLRLVKVIVQPVFVLDDGETLAERATEPVTVSPADWPTYPTTGFVQATEALQAQLDAAGGNGQPANRAQRRSAAKRTKSGAKTT
jgi:hypothetical protein